MIRSAIRFSTLALIALIALIALSACHSVNAGNLPEIFAQVARSVVSVHVAQWIVKGTSNKEVILLPSQGSGVLISADGKVITAAHLVQSADMVTIETHTGDRVPARVIASEPAADIALLQLERAPASVAPAMLDDGVSLAETRGYEPARAKLALLNDGDILQMTVLRSGRQLNLSAPVSR